ncbi:M23 family metallopeptidase [Paenibacillus sp. NPDC093718]|uniref:M23 family metallopeptidase n=1 Tax=Paenibacillus sp. NPDC093718 TaxID=3390601 RepID=UPI003CFCD0E6
MLKLKLILSMLDNPEKFLKIFLIAIAVLALFINLFIVTPTMFWKHVPMGKSQAEYDYYLKGAEQIQEETGIAVNWQYIMAIDAVILDHNFRKASQERAYSYKPYFIREEIITVEKTCTNDKGEEYDCSYTETVYHLRPFDETLQMLVDDRHIKPDQIQDVMDKVQYVIEVTDGKVKFVGGPDEDGESGDGIGEFQPVTGTMGWPTENHITRITSPFGWRTHPITGVKKLHRGMDIGTPMNTNVYAALDGEITKAGWDSSGGGNTVIIRHADGMVTKYMHLNSFVIRSGSVKAGQLIAKSGNTGGSTGPHLHFGVEINGEPVDPMMYYR